MREEIQREKNPWHWRKRKYHSEEMECVKSVNFREHIQVSKNMWRSRLKSKIKGQKLKHRYKHMTRKVKCPKNNVGPHEVAGAEILKVHIQFSW